MRILKLSLILEIDEELTKIFKVEDMGQFSKKKIHSLVANTFGLLNQSINQINVLSELKRPISG